MGAEVSLSSYNGWSGPFRQRLFDTYKRELKAGRIPAPYATPCPCEMCGQTRGTMLHQEEYGPTLEEYLKASHWLCGRCHAMLHLRFRFPGRWAYYKAHVKAHGVQPYIPNMGAVYHASRGWKDYPVVDYGVPGDSWWERLTCDRYAGPVKG